MKKKLIEVALPLDKINEAASREKNIRHGHPSTLHLWWSRKPLAACRAVIFASLVDDPSSDPVRFPTEEAQQLERDRLFAILEQLVQWDNSNNSRVLSAARREIFRSSGEAPPIVFDPFSGGGSIPLEAQRLGLGARGSDLNPVAVLISKAMTEIPTSFINRSPVNPDSASRKALKDYSGTEGMAEDLRYYGKWMRDKAHERIGKFYPKAQLPQSLGGGEAPTIAWVWARTVKCPNPACGVEMPLASKFLLSMKKGRETWAEPVFDQTPPRLRFKIVSGEGNPPSGTVGRRGARCARCSQPVDLDYIRVEARSGRMSARMMAIVAEGKSGRIYLPPDSVHEGAALAEDCSWKPDTALPERALGFRVQAYGMTHHADLFSARQLLALTTFSDLVSAARERAIADGADVAYADALSTYLALAVSRSADFWCTIATWSPQAKNELVSHAFTRQAIPMTWDFGEANPFSESGGNFIGNLGFVIKFVCSVPDNTQPTQIRQADASKAEYPPRSMVFCTDPPYYDNIGYADLSDFFYVWLRRSLKVIYPDLFSTMLVPKDRELVASPHRHEGEEGATARDVFEKNFRLAFQAMQRGQHPEYPLTVFYAFKQSENEETEEGIVVASTGWETMLEGLISSGFQVTGTWPLRSERSARSVALGTNALASSIVLVCRPRAQESLVATEMDFQTALRSELPRSLRTMQQESVAPVDLAQASIGPGMAVYSRYSKVLGPDGKPVAVRRALEMINRVLDEVLSEQEGEFDSDTRFALAWFQQFGMRSGTFGTADVLSRAMNIGVAGMENAGILEARSGTVRLLKWEELPEDWDPDKDRRLTVWEMTHHLIRLMYKESDAAAARLLSKLGDDAEKARDLAYRLYQICERSKWSQDAQPYNALVVAWPNLTSEARQLEKKTSPEQLTL